MCYRVLLLLLLSINAKGQVNSGARFTGMGNTGTALRDVYSLMSNQAGVANFETPILSFSFQTPFLGTDISSQSVLFVLPVRVGVLGYTISNYGIPKVYSNLKSGLSFSRSFGPQLAMAMTVNYHQLQIPNYGSSRAFSIEFGAQCVFIERWIIGAHIENPGHFNYKTESYYQIPSILRLGNSFKMNEQILLSIDGIYRLSENFDANVGIEYSLVEYLKLRGGISFNHFQQYAGFGIDYQNFLFDVAAILHPRLGISPQIALSYVF